MQLKCWFMCYPNHSIVFFSTYNLLKKNSWNKIEMYLHQWPPPEPSHLSPHCCCDQYTSASHSRGTATVDRGCEADRGSLGPMPGTQSCYPPNYQNAGFASGTSGSFLSSTAELQTCRKHTQDCETAVNVDITKSTLSVPILPGFISDVAPGLVL